jgi:hypothetical protein
MSQRINNKLDKEQVLILLNEIELFSCEDCHFGHISYNLQNVLLPGRRWDKGTSLGLLDIPKDGGACSPQSMNEGLENNSIQQKEDKKKPTVLISFKFVAS